MILIDAHVHIYDCFDLRIFLDSALSNFRAEASRQAKKDNFSALLLLTESEDINWFQILETYADGKRRIRLENGGWTLHRTTENCSLCAQREDGHSLYIVEGRQIVTAENLEVLALISDRQFADGNPIVDVIQAVRDDGSLAVIPWGFGKWMGSRGRILKDILKDVNGSELFLGDNGGRSAFWPRPNHFKLAEAKGLRVLPGSDPLPFITESRRPGSFGFMVDGSLDHEKPAKYIKDILLDSRATIKAYGSLESPHRFLLNQFRMQLNKQLRKRKIP